MSESRVVRNAPRKALRASLAHHFGWLFTAFRSSN
jgi:hypothetical protein